MILFFSVKYEVSKKLFSDDWEIVILKKFVCESLVPYFIKSFFLHPGTLKLRICL